MKLSHQALRNRRNRHSHSLPHMVAFGVALVLLTSSCSLSGSGEPASPDRVRIVLPEEPPTLDPCQGSQSSTGRVVRNNITEGLTFRNPSDSSVEPLLAQSWSNPEPRTWVFALRPGVTFQDGRPLTAPDVVASFVRLLNPDIACNVAGQFFTDNDIEATATDDLTVRIVTTAPDPILPLRVSFVGITPADTPSDTGVREPVGTGPYRIESWQVGNRLTLARYDGYWGEKPNFASATYVWRAEDSVRAAMIGSDEADVATALSSLRKDSIGAVTFDTNETAYFRTDPTQAPMDDERVRQAIDLSLDRENILKAIFGGVGEVASQLVPDGVIGHNPDLQPTNYDPDRAKQLVTEAKADGVPVETPIVIVGRNDIYPRAAEAAEVVQSTLTDAGLNVSIKMLDVNAWLEYALRPFPVNTDATLLQGQHGNQAGDAAFTLANNYGSEGGQSTYGTPEIDALIEQGEAASGDERQKDFADALAAEKDLVRDVVLVRVGGVIAISPKVDYTPDSATYDEMRVSEMTYKG